MEMDGSNSGTDYDLVSLRLPILLLPHSSSDNLLISYTQLPASFPQVSHMTCVAGGKTAVHSDEAVGS